MKSDLNITDSVVKVTDWILHAGNKGGSYLTIWSNGGLQFGLINVFAGFGNVWADQSYWQSAIAAKPNAAYKGYLLGGLAWCAPVDSNDL